MNQILRVRGEGKRDKYYFIPGQKHVRAQVNSLREIWEKRGKKMRKQDKMFYTELEAPVDESACKAQKKNWNPCEFVCFLFFPSRFRPVSLMYCGIFLRRG